MTTPPPPQSTKRTDAGRIGGPIVIPNCVQCNVVWQFTTTHFARIVMHSTVAAAFSATQTIANNLFNGLVTSFSGANGLGSFTPTTVNLFSVELKDLRSANLPVVPSNVAPVPGTSASPLISFQNALVVTLRTAQSGRGFRGRAYIPGWATNADAGQGSASSVAGGAAVAFINQLNSTMLANGMTIAIGQPHRRQYLGVTGTNHPERFANTVNLTAILTRDLLWDQQRRRVGL